MINFTFQDSGLVIVSSEEGVFSLSKCSDLSDISVTPSGASLISQEAAEILNKAGEGTLGKSNQVMVPASKQKIVVDSVDSIVDDDKIDTVIDKNVDDKVDSVDDRGDKIVNNASKGTDEAVIIVHADDKNGLEKEVEISGLKEQTVTQISNDKVKKEMIKTANEIDVNSNNVEQGLNSDSQNDAADSNKNLDSKLDETNNNAGMGEVDSGIKIELNLLGDSANTDSKDNVESTETYGLSKSMVAKLARMTGNPDNEQGLCSSISFESDVTYHREESEDELLDNDETEVLDKADKENQDKIDRTKVTTLPPVEISDDVTESKESESPTTKVRFKLGEEKVAESTAGLGSGYVPGTDQFMDELHFRAFGKVSNMLPVENVDEVSSMIVDYDPNENLSVSTGIGDLTDDRYQDFISNPDSGDEESQLNAKAKIDLEYAAHASEKEIPDEFVDALAGSYGAGKVDTIFPVASVDDIGSMIVCYDPNETASIGDITDSRLGDTDSRLAEFESNANSTCSEDEEEKKSGTGEDVTADEPENIKVLSLADRPGLVGVPGIRDPRLFLDASQSCDDVSSMMVEYDQSETVSVSDVTDMFENVDNTDMTEDNVRRKDYVPGNVNTIGNWVRSVSRDETTNQNIGDTIESDSGEHEQDKDGDETPLERFARNYVNDIIQDASEIICGAPTENKTESEYFQDVNASGKDVKDQDVIDHDSSIIMGEPLNVSTPSKKDVSEEVMPLERPCDRSSVDIVSPITHVTEQETNKDVEFFSYKLQTQASVVLSSTGKSDSGDITLEEKDEPMSPILPDISGYGVCISGEGIEEMEKYYKEMAAISETIEKTELAVTSDQMSEKETIDQLASPASAGSHAKDDVFFDAKETVEETEESKSKVKDGEEDRKEDLPHGGSALDEEPLDSNTQIEEMKIKNELPLGDTEVVKDPDNKIDEEPGNQSIIDSWAKQAYEAAAGHDPDDQEEILEKLTDETKEESSSIDTLDTETDKHVSASAEGALGKDIKEKHVSFATDSEAVSKRKKSKKHDKEARPSSSDVDKHGTSAEVDSEHHGKKGSHSKKRKDAKDENCSVS